MDDVGCVGTEARLWDCPTPGIGVNDCSHFEDASVQCVGKERVKHINLLHNSVLYKFENDYNYTLLLYTVINVIIITVSSV